MVSAVHGLLKRGIMDKSIVSANFFLVPRKDWFERWTSASFFPKMTLEVPLMDRLKIGIYLTYGLFLRKGMDIIAPDFFVAHR